MKKRLSKKEMDVYKEKLFNLKDDMLTQIRDISKDTLMKTQKEMSGDISGYSIHMADMASDNYERDFNIGLVSNERKTVTAIDEALKRLEDKEYGTCENCKKDIAKNRLKAIPYARYCKKCKEKLENENRV